MPKTTGEMKRIRQMHAEGDHDRCDIRHCDAAAREFAELEGGAEDYGLACKALLALIAARGLDAGHVLGDNLAATVKAAEAAEGEPDFVHEAQAEADLSAPSQLRLPVE